MIQLYNDDCLNILPTIADNSIDMILCDLPYGITRNKLDSVIPLVDLWNQYNRIIKDNCAIALFSAQPFTSQLVLSNIKMFRYELIWDKGHGTDFLNRKSQAIKIA